MSSPATPFLTIHPKNPQNHLLQKAKDVLVKGGVVIYPTDSCYAIGCLLDATDAVERIRRIRQLDEAHFFSLLCQDLSEISHYALISNPIFRFVRHLIPGPYTFLLRASHEIPRRLKHPKRKTIGLRVPDSVIVQNLLKLLEMPLLSTSLILPGGEWPLSDPDEIKELVSNQVDAILDGGEGEMTQTTVVDCTQDVPVLVRQGKGKLPEFFESLS